MTIPNFTIADLAEVMSPEEIAEYFNTLDPQEVLKIKYHWPFWARPAQLPPTSGRDGRDNWTYWMLLAGRGFGKTRVGAEWVRSIAEKGNIEYIHMIAPTNGDIRGVMIEGESGLLNISPPWFKPVYEPSKRRVVWPNGVKAYLFSAEEPDRLRGPQCFAAGTMVTTRRGYVAIENVVPGDEVWTRIGWCPVLKSGLTSSSASTMELRFSNRRSIRCTNTHLFIDPEGGYKRAVDHDTGDKVWGEFQSNTTAGSITSALVDILCGSPKLVEFVEGLTSTEMYGKTKSGPYQRGTSFTTRTKTSQTTILKILRQNLSVLTLRTILGSHCAATLTLEEGRRWQLQLPVPPRLWLMLLAKLVRVFSSEKNLLDLLNGTVPKDATESLCAEASRLGLRGPALFAEKNSSLKSPLLSGVPIAGTGTGCEVIETINDGVEEPVYNITVDGPPEFYANGILVKNCGAFWADELAAWEHLEETWSNIVFGFRLGRRPQGVITTTPRPLKKIRELLGNMSCVSTRGSTYDNRANLAEPFFDEVITAYEGTRLGRQELDGEVLEDNPNAIFQQEWFDRVRVDFAPRDLDKIVVAVDPQVKENIDSDECGIVVVGVKKIDKVKHYYILADSSLKPISIDQWSREVVKQFFMWQADKVVAEVNNGGTLVVKTIQSVNSDVPCEEVTATRGKTKRAEPIATLAEQGRIHFVGKLGTLETQCVEWDPTLEGKKGAQKSPDRMDAMVWGVAYLSGMKGAGMVQRRAAGN